VSLPKAEVSDFNILSLLTSKLQLIECMFNKNESYNNMDK
jgi:hypothetical protein